MLLEGLICGLRHPLSLSGCRLGLRCNICVSNRKLAIIRDIPILKVKRCEGSNVRGTRPITVFFEKYQVFKLHMYYVS